MPYHARATASKRRLKSLALLAAVTARMALMVFRMQLQNTLEVQHAASSKCLKTTEDNSNGNVFSDSQVCFLNLSSTDPCYGLLILHGSGQHDKGSS